PIYGLAAAFEPIHDRIARWSWPLRGGLWTLMIYAVEYASGWLLRVVTGRCPWDYHGSTRFELNGLIRLDYAPAWFCAGLLFERVHRWLDRELR
ncbi:MAG: putative ABC transporter permease, partial [Bacillota bacterium]